MQIPIEILKGWKEMVLKQGITVVAKGAKINYRTLKTSLVTGVIAKKPYGKMNAYIIREAKTRIKVANAIDDNN